MLNIPKKIVIGYDTKGVGERELFKYGEICPDEPVRKGRITSIQRNKDYSASVDNTPLPGFTIVKQRGSWYGSQKYWSVIDPRGFSITISSSNLSQIIQCTGVTEGLVHEPCVWGYDAGNIVLLPQNSEPYELATANTAILDSRIYLKDVNIGDTVFLQNKVKGTYYGAFSYCEPEIRSACINYKVFKRVYLLQGVTSKSRLTYYYKKSSIKISSIEQRTRTPLTKAEALDTLYPTMFSYPFITDHVPGPNSTASTWNEPIQWFTEAKPKTKLKLIDIEFDEFRKIFEQENKHTYTRKTSCYGLYNGQLYKIQRADCVGHMRTYNCSIGDKIEAHEVREIDYDNGMVEFEVMQKPSTNTRYSRYSANVRDKFITKTIEIHLQDIEKYYIIRHIHT